MTEETKHIREGGSSSGEPQPALFRLWFSSRGICHREEEEKRGWAFPAVETRGREKQSKTLKRKEEQVLDSTEKQHTVEQSIL